MKEDIGWLRAAVWGANDGIVSTASLVLGVALRMGLAATYWQGTPVWSLGYVDGCGGCVSVHSQAETGPTDIDQGVRLEHMAS